jgi:hypothetical protein
MNINENSGQAKQECSGTETQVRKKLPGYSLIASCQLH